MDLLADAAAMSDQYRNTIGPVSVTKHLPGDEDTACRELMTSEGHFVLKAYSDRDRCGTEISRDSPDCFSQPPTMIAEWASDRESGPEPS